MKNTFTRQEVVELLKEQDKAIRDTFIKEFIENAEIADDFNVTDIASTWRQAANVCDKFKVNFDIKESQQCK